MRSLVPIFALICFTACDVTTESGELPSLRARYGDACGISAPSGDVICIDHYEANLSINKSECSTSVIADYSHMGADGYAYITAQELSILSRCRMGSSYFGICSLSDREIVYSDSGIWTEAEASSDCESLLGSWELYEPTPSD